MKPFICLPGSVDGKCPLAFSYSEWEFDKDVFTKPCKTLKRIDAISDNIPQRKGLPFSPQKRHGTKTHKKAHKNHSCVIHQTMGSFICSVWQTTQLSLPVINFICTSQENGILKLVSVQVVILWKEDVIHTMSDWNESQANTDQINFKKNAGLRLSFKTKPETIRNLSDDDDASGHTDLLPSKKAKIRQRLRSSLCLWKKPVL